MEEKKIDGTGIDLISSYEKKGPEIKEKIIINHWSKRTERQLFFPEKNFFAYYFFSSFDLAKSWGSRVVATTVSQR
jgi:hypothetical protein